MVVNEKPHRKRTKKQKQQQQQQQKNRIPHLYHIMSSNFALAANATLIIVKRFFSLQLYYKDIKSYSKSYRRDYNPRKHNQRHKKSFFRKRKTTTALRIMHAKTDNIKIIISNKANEMIEGFYDSLLQKYQKGLDESIKTASLLLIMLIYCPINIIK